MYVYVYGNLFTTVSVWLFLYVLLWLVLRCRVWCLRRGLPAHTRQRAHPRLTETTYHKCTQRDTRTKHTHNLRQYTHTYKINLCIQLCVYI